MTLTHSLAEAPTGLTTYIGLVVLIPFVTSLLLLVLGRKTDKFGHWVATVASAVSAVISLATLMQFLSSDVAHRIQEVDYGTWIKIADLKVSFGFLVDPLSLTFICLVTFVGTLIHIYAVAYMEHDTDRRRFFAYLNLFVSAMLILVLANSYTLLFMGWEGVGLASYLLIGFWNHVPENAVAAKKAFVMNRVGDAGLLIAMMSIFAFTGSLTYSEVFGADLTTAQASVIGIFLLVGACGKSAQLPLQAWLGDAMAGPTPVSALIHAATMVTAGVYLVVRSAPIYAHAPMVSLIVALVGAVTIVFGAFVGCAKTDMKKVLAASTMSQIGYMMLAAGLGPVGYAFAIFHLLTHGFFKANLFLGAGSVMHAMSDDVNIFHFGALRKYMKITWVTFAVAWLAILGLPPFSGYWSKDKIIEAAFMPGLHGEVFAYVFGFVALIGAGITAFYMSRLFFMIFHGKQRFNNADSCDGTDNCSSDVKLYGDKANEYHPHESSALMWVPMVILSVFSAFLGLALSVNSNFITWLEPVTGHAEHSHTVIPESLIQILTIVLVVIATAIAYILYAKSTVRESNNIPAVVKLARNDFGQDQINKALFVTPSLLLAKFTYLFDKKVLDGFIGLLASASLLVSKYTLKSQSGYLRQYVAYIFAGVVLILLIVVSTIMMAIG